MLLLGPQRIELRTSCTWTNCVMSPSQFLIKGTDVNIFCYSNNRGKTRMTLTLSLPNRADERARASYIFSLRQTIQNKNNVLMKFEATSGVISDVKVTDMIISIPTPTGTESSKFLFILTKNSPTFFTNNNAYDNMDMYIILCKKT